MPLPAAAALRRLVQLCRLVEVIDMFACAASMLCSFVGAAPRGSSCGGRPASMALAAVLSGDHAVAEKPLMAVDVEPFLPTQVFPGETPRRGMQVGVAGWRQCV